MKDLRIEKLANNLLTYSVNIKKGENILIEVLGEDGILLAKELIKKAEELGANPFFNIIDYELLRVMLENATEDQIKLYAKHDEARMKDMDAYIGIRATSNTAELNGIPKEVIELYNSGERKLSVFKNKLHLTDSTIHKILDENGTSIRKAQTGNNREKNTDIKGINWDINSKRWLIKHYFNKKQ